MTLDTLQPDIIASYEEVIALHEAGDAQGAIDAADRIGAELGERYGNDSWESGYALLRLAQLMLADEQVESGLPCFTAAVERFRKFPAREPLVRLEALDQLAQIHCLLGQHQEALAVMLEALEVHTALPAAQAPADNTPRQWNLAELELMTGALKEAETHLRQALTTWTEEFGDAEQALSAISLQLRNRDQPDAAEVPMRILVELLKQRLGPQHPEVAKHLNFLGLIHEEQGDHAGAIPLFEEALAIRVAIGGDDPETIRVLNNLGGQHLILNRFKQARTYLRQALEMRERLLGLSHPDVALNLTFLARTYRDEEDYERAIPLYLRALDIQRNACGDDSDQVAETLRNLMGCCMGAGDYVTPIPYAELEIDIRRRTRGERHADVADSLGVLSSMCYKTGRLADAERHAKAALDIQRETLGDLAPAVSKTLDNLQRICIAAGRYQDALPWLELERDIRRQTLGEAHPDFADTLAKLATIRSTLGDHKEAEALFNQALDIAHHTEPPALQAMIGTLLGLIEIHAASGKRDEAQPLMRRALELQRQCASPHDEALADTLEKLATAEQDFGRYAAAEPLLGEALAIRRTLPENGRRDLGVTLLDFADLNKTLGKLQSAQPLYEEALTVLRDAVGEPHALVAKALAGLSRLHAALADNASASSFAQEALDMRRALHGADHPACADSLDDLANLARARSDFQDAARLFDEAVDILIRAERENTALYATVLNDRAGLSKTLGDYAAAEADYLRSLELRKQMHGDAHPSVADALSNLGLLYLAWGRFRRAERHLRTAVAMLRIAYPAGGDRLAKGLSNLGNLLHDIGDDKAAEPLYREAAAMLREALGDTHPDVGIALNNHAQVLDALGDTEAALPLYRQAFQVFSSAGVSHPMFSACFNVFASLHQRAGLHDIALHSLEAATELLAERSGRKTVEYATLRQNLANVYATMGNHAAAEPIYREAIGHLRDALGDTHPTVAAVLLNLAKTCAATGREPEALTLMQQAASMHEHMMAQVFSIGSERQRLQYLDTLQSARNLFLSLMLQFPALAPDAEPAAFDLILRRKAIGLEVLAAQRDAVLGGRYPHLRTRLRELALLRTRIAEKTLAGSGAEGRDVHQALLVEWSTRKDDEEAALAREIPEMQLERVRAEADRASITACLPQGAALIELVRCPVFDFNAVQAKDQPEWLPARYLAFVAHADASKAMRMIDLGESAAIDALIDGFRNGIGVGDRHLTGAVQRREKKHANDGLALRRAIFDPLLSALGDCRRLFIAPDGKLAQIPFEVLPEDSGARLIDHYRISYLGAGRDLLRFNLPLPVQPAAPVVLADPDFDLAESAPAVLLDDEEKLSLRRDADTAALHFNRLPGTHEEGKAIAALLGVDALLDAHALEAALKRCASPSVLHLATHGFFLPDHPSSIDEPNGRLSGARLTNPLLRSGLALAGANGWLRGEALPPEAEDGILTAEDVSAMDLYGTSLVVLSACDTGLGDMHAGEGVFGLRRAFVLAGARTLVMSLWKVPDDQTRALMIDMYQRLALGESRADALRGAQLALKEKYPEPLYWGAFVCLGEVGVLPRTNALPEG